ncbi:hypothetical protein G5S37_19390 [Roseimicrobium sp. ORNL1]|nr:hypothetical protein G5S37_19390 [Roseimicrobium sp. ORNL1]
MSAGEKVSWPHAPTHRLLEGGAYFVTASTYEKQHHFRGKGRLSRLHDNLLQCCLNYGWRLQAWAVFSNHYHFVAHCEDRESASKLPWMLGLLHEQTTKQVNHEDGVEERKVWYNYWDTFLSNQRSYFARLNYVHQNPVKHGLVKVASQYPWCSASWFERTSSPAQVKAIYRFQTGRVQVKDDFEPSVDW